MYKIVTIIHMSQTFIRNISTLPQPTLAALFYGNLWFLSACKEIEENNRMGKTRYLFKKIRYTKGTFHAKMGTIKDRNGMDLTEAEDIKKRWQGYTEELYKKKRSS